VWQTTFLHLQIFAVLPRSDSKCGDDLHLLWSRDVIGHQHVVVWYPMQFWFSAEAALHESIVDRMSPKHFGGNDLPSRDVIGHVSIRFAISNFLLVVLWNRAYISIGFYERQHICYSAYNAIARLSVRLSDGWIIEKWLKLRLWNFHRMVAASL